jgi:peptide/nickel transport system permease protein
VLQVAIESYTVVGNTIVYVEYNDEPSLKMVKEINLAEGYSSIISAEKTLLKKDFYLGTDKYGRDLLSRMLMGPEFLFLLAL